METYQRRYLWVAALEIVEHDALDATAGKPDTRGIPASFKSSPTLGVLGSLTPARQSVMADYAESIKDRFQADDIIGAYELASEIQDIEEKIGLWSLLDSKCRSAIKRHSESLKPQTETA